MAEHRIWFDCDTGVDDAIALLTAHRQPGLEIVGLTIGCMDSKRMCSGA